MTTAHRPTWNSAIGSGSNPSGALFVCQTTKLANRDVANAGILKSRKVGQGAPEERGSQKEFAEDLERRERKAREGNTLDKEEVKAREEQRLRAIENNPFPEDADDDAPSDSDKESAEGDDDEDDTEELMRELAKIKREREEAEQKQKDLQQKQDERSKRDMIMKGNPLVAGTDLSLKRKWDDDTVFKNQARTAPKPKLRFINDAVRSDFHRKFLQKYVWVDGIAH